MKRKISIIALVLLSLVISTINLEAQDNPTRKIDKEFSVFYKEFQTAVKKNDKQALLGMTYDEDESILEAALEPYSKNIIKSSIKKYAYQYKLDDNFQWPCDVEIEGNDTIIIMEFDGNCFGPIFMKIDGKYKLVCGYGGFPCD
jgi:hypothetical protein